MLAEPRMGESDPSSNSRLLLCNPVKVLPRVLAGLGIPQEKICQLVINSRTGKPLDDKSLRKHFKREIATGEIELHMQVGNFIASTILGRAPPPGTVAIDNPHVRGSLAIFFARTRMGWKEPVVNRTRSTSAVRSRMRRMSGR